MQHLKNFGHFLENWQCTLLSFIFLLLGIFLPAKVLEKFWFSPLWLTLFISGLPILLQAIFTLKEEKGIQKLSSNLLITLGTLASIYIGDVLAAAEIVFIMAIGTLLEEKTVERSKKGLYLLLKNSPTEARIFKKDQFVSVPIEEVGIGDVLRILPGESIPVDAKVLSGESSVNQAVLTGESLPVDKEKGDEIFGGTQNLYGTLDAVATKKGEDSSLQRLVKLVQEAEERKAPMQKTADRFASFMVPLSIFTALITYLITGELSRAVSVLVVFCPCALVLATPTAVMAAIGQATKHGIIIKSGEVLEKMGKVNMLSFDKTGTLTHAKLQVAEVVLFHSSYSKDAFIHYVASAEQKSEHPLAQAIVHFAKKTSSLEETKSFKMFAGKGVQASFENIADVFYIGNKKFLIEERFSITETMEKCVLPLSEKGNALVWVGTKNEDALSILGVLALSDTVKEEAKDILASLKSLHTQSFLLTGDNQKTASFFANFFGLEEFYTDLLPQDKAKIIEKKQATGASVCMVGDGVNDALALKTANVGIAMGALGSDLAVEAADIVLLNDDLKNIPYLKKLSLACVRTIGWSIFLSMAINFVALGLSVVGLLNPTGGALVHNLGSVLVILLAALLYDRKFHIN